MLKACHYCGRIHEMSFICPQKEEADRKRRRTRGKGEKEDAFRNSSRWRKIREEALHRDRRLCLCCLADLEGTERLYNTEDLSVHHITPLREDYSKRGNLDNMLTVCRYHHERCESGEISRELQRRLVEWSSEGLLNLKEKLIEEGL